MINSLSQLLHLMHRNGAVRVYAKKLSPNDNSKNQIYLGGDFSVLNILPHSEIYADEVATAGSKRDRTKAKLSFYWIDENGKYLAPEAQLILYPKYPEVRMSGVLKSCNSAPSKILTVRDLGRILFLGVTNNGEVLGYATDSENSILLELKNQN